MTPGGVTSPRQGQSVNRPIKIKIRDVHVEGCRLAAFHIDGEFDLSIDRAIVKETPVFLEAHNEPDVSIKDSRHDP